MASLCPDVFVSFTSICHSFIFTGNAWHCSGRRSTLLNGFFSTITREMIMAGGLGLFILSGCNSISYNFPDTKPTSSIQQTTARKPDKNHLRFDDSRPHEWNGRKPWHYPVHGTDISKYQKDVNWDEVRRSGISFVYIKATEGGDRIDNYFSRNWQGAEKAGIPRGAYHFYYFCRPAEDQARWFIRNVPKDKTALPPVLDMEWNHKSPTCKLHPTADIVRREMKIFLDIVEQHYGKRPVIYTTVDFFDDNELQHFKQYPFWLRSVADHPDDKYSKHSWIFWQYTGTGKIPGIEGDVDLNVFAGSNTEWQAWLERAQQQDNIALQASNNASALEIAD